MLAPEMAITGVDIRGVPEGPDNERVFSALVMAISGLLIDRGIVTLEELKTRTRNLAESPVIPYDQDFVRQVIRDILDDNFLREEQEKREQAEEAAKLRPPVP